MQNLDRVLTEEELREPVGSIRKALYSQVHRDQLRQSVTEVVERAVDDVYERKVGNIQVDKEELTDVAWQSFVPTIGRYIEQSRMLRENDEQPYKFSTKLNFHVRKRLTIYIKNRRE